MSLGLKYKVGCRSLLDDSAWTAYIYKSGHTGDCTNLKGSGNVIELRQESKDLLSPLIGTSVTITIQAETRLQLVEFLYAKNKEYRIDIYEQKTGDDARRFMSFFLLPEGCSMRYIGGAHIVTLTGTDGLADLKSIEYRNGDTLYTGWETDLEIVRRCLDQIGLSNVITHIIDGTDLYETGYNPGLANYQTNQDRFLDEKDDGLEPWSCYEVLEAILGSYGCRLFQSTRSWWILRIEEQDRDEYNEGEGYTVRRYTMTDGSYVDDHVIDAGVEITDTPSLIYTESKVIAPQLLDNPGFDIWITAIDADGWGELNDADFVTNGLLTDWDSSGNLADWTEYTTGSAAITESTPGMARLYAPDGDYANIYQSVNLTNGYKYGIIIRVNAVTSGSVKVYFDAHTETLEETISTPGQHVFWFTADFTTDDIVVSAVPSGLNDVEIDYVLIFRRLCIEKEGGGGVRMLAVGLTTYIYQTSMLTIGKLYKIVVDVGEINEGYAYVDPLYVTGTEEENRLSLGTNILYRTAIHNNFVPVATNELGFSDVTINYAYLYEYSFGGKWIPYNNSLQLQALPGWKSYIQRQDTGAKNLIKTGDFQDDDNVIDDYWVNHGCCTGSS